MDIPDSFLTCSLAIEVHGDAALPPEIGVCLFAVSAILYFRRWKEESKRSSRRKINPKRRCSHILPRSPDSDGACCLVRTSTTRRKPASPVLIALVLPPPDLHFFLLAVSVIRKPSPQDVHALETRITGRRRDIYPSPSAHRVVLR